MSQLIHKNNKEGAKNEKNLQEKLQEYTAISYFLKESQWELRSKAKISFGLGTLALAASSAYHLDSAHQAMHCGDPITSCYSLTSACLLGTGCFLVGAGAALETIAACLENNPPKNKEDPKTSAKGATETKELNPTKTAHEKQT